MAVSVETFRRIALEDGDSAWEYHCGRLVRKPPMTMPHNRGARELARQLIMQLDPDLYRVSQNAGHLRIGDERYLIPDVSVIPVASEARLAERPFDLEEYAEPLPFVAEVWSRSTGDYDVDEKFPAYVRRGDVEIWRVHPYEQTVDAWRKRGDGTYAEAHYSKSDLEAPIESLDVTIDLGRLFRE